MTGILRQLMDFARRRSPKREEASLLALCESTLALLAPLADRRGVTVHVRETDAPSALIDVGQMQQVLTNLVVNAIQATPSGGEVVMELSTRDATNPSIPEAATAPHVCIEVSDTGEGVAKEHLSRVFEPFFTTKDVGEGTGLGLSVAYGIVVDHGGWIEVAHRDGGGTVFRVWIPIQPGGGHAASGASLPG